MHAALAEMYPAQKNLFTAANIVTVAKALLTENRISLKEAPAAPAAAGANAAHSRGGKGGGAAGKRLWGEATPGKRQLAEAKLVLDGQKQEQRKKDIEAAHKDVTTEWTNDLKDGHVAIFGLDPKNGLAACAADAGLTFDRLRRLNEKATKYASDKGLPEQKELLEMSKTITEAVEAVVSARAGEDFVKKYLDAKRAEQTRKQAEAAASAAAGRKGRRKKKKSLFRVRLSFNFHAHFPPEWRLSEAGPLSGACW